jgi:hypothetical protein
VTALQAIGDTRSKPKPQPPPAAAATPAGTVAAPGATPNANAAPATAQRATPVAIPPQGIQIMIPGGQTIVSLVAHSS